MSVGSGQAFNQLPWSFVNKDIPPGWHGPGTERTFVQWFDDLKRWKKLNSYDNDESRISALEFRVSEDVKAKMSTFPPRPVPPPPLQGPTPEGEEEEGAEKTPDDQGASSSSVTSSIPNREFLKTGT